MVGTDSELPTQCGHVNPCGKHASQIQLAPLSRECPSVPRKTLEYNMLTRQLTIPDGTPRSDFVQRRVLVPSKDETLVPLSLVYRDRPEVAAAEELIEAPVNVALIAYGAYGEPVSLAYDPTLQPLLDRGFVVAYAHTRGGGELGRAWHLRGRGREKPRAVEDYLACAEALVSGTVLNNRPVLQLVAKGTSAGGILVGAAVNQRPDLFCKVVMTNAFLDLDATMRRPSLHLTQHEWDEYGNPLEDEAAARAIASICPILNVSDSAQQPQFLIVGTLDDQSVPVENAVVYAKKIREKSGAHVLLHIESEGGHQLLENRLRVAAVESTFIAGNESFRGNVAVAATTSANLGPRL